MEFIKKFVVAIVITIIILSMYTCVGHAATTVTIDDVTAVVKQLAMMDEEMDMLAQLVWAEARGVDSTAEQAAVIWCVLNRVDVNHRGDTIKDVVTSPSQFAYTRNAPVKDELRELAQDVLTRWLLEKRGVEDVGRVLPKEYIFFAGRGGHNWFRTAYRSREYWDWSLPNPYED